MVVDAIAYTGMYDKLSTEIKAGEATHDVGCLDVVWLAAFKDAIEPVMDADTSDRKDLIPEDKVPKTWEEYRALAEELAADGMYGTTVFGSGSDAVCVKQADFFKASFHALEGCFYKLCRFMFPRAVSYDFPVKEANKYTYVVPACTYPYICALAHRAFVLLRNNKGFCLPVGRGTLLIQSICGRLP